MGATTGIGSGFAIAFPLVLMLTLMGYGTSGIYHGLLRPRSDLLIWAAGPPAMLLYILVRRAGVPLPIWGAIATSYSCSGLVACLQLWRDRLLGPPLPWRAMRPVFHNLLPALTFTFFTVFSAWSDRWVVGSQLGAVPLGLYAAAVAVIQAALRVPTSIAYTIVPAAAKAALGGSEISARLNRAVISAFGWFSVLMIVVILLLAPVIIRILFGPGFLPATRALYFMTPTLLAAAISYPFMSALTGSTRNYRLLLALGLTVPARVLLLYWFTHHSYVTGTALATGLADALLAIYCVFLARRVNIVLPLGALLQPCGMGVVAYAVGGALLWFGVPAPLATLAAVGVFAPALLSAARALHASVG